MVSVNGAYLVDQVVAINFMDGNLKNCLHRETGFLPGSKAKKISLFFQIIIQFFQSRPTFQKICSQFWIKLSPKILFNC